MTATRWRPSRHTSGSSPAHRPPLRQPPEMAGADRHNLDHPQPPSRARNTCPSRSRAGTTQKAPQSYGDGQIDCPVPPDPANLAIDWKHKIGALEPPASLPSHAA
jgi:hypothetical protein